mmetsp:Transcript_1804/g.4944  ORF Transcript_1804/g.4944 Transcript_1804/m.4944 type:complete len:87 (-) Transcript_1804:71-331(-)
MILNIYFYKFVKLSKIYIICIFLILTLNLKIFYFLLMILLNFVILVPLLCGILMILVIRSLVVNIILLLKYFVVVHIAQQKLIFGA